jgi:ABC-type protease/lipase transport system fused ATPase/permease subunit
MRKWPGATERLSTHPKTYIVQASNLTSKEVYAFPDGHQQAVLRNVNLQVRRGESWGIISNEPFESELLLEIIGNVRPTARDAACWSSAA